MYVRKKERERERERKREREREKEMEVNPMENLSKLRNDPKYPSI